MDCWINVHHYKLWAFRLCASEASKSIDFIMHEYIAILSRLLYVSTLIFSDVDDRMDFLIF